ncbi:MFS transporter [Streptomyces ziwulingensis]
MSAGGAEVAVTSPDGTRLRGHPVLRAVLLAETVSILGTQLSTVATPWLVLTLTGSPAAMGLVTAAQFAGVAVFGMIGASWVARLGPRRVMVGGDLLCAALLALLPLLHAVDRLSVGVFAAVMFTVGATFAPYLASQQCVLLAVAGTDERLLTRTNAAFQAATRLSMLLGPLLAGVLIATVTASQVLLWDALSFVVSALLLGRRLPTTTGAAPPPRSSFGTGLRALRSDRLVRSWSLGLTLNEVAWQAMFALIPLVTLARAAASPVAAGALLAAYGGGTLLGSVAVGRALRLVPPRTLAAAGRIGCAAVFPLLSLPLGVSATACCLAVTGLLNGVSLAPATAVRLLRMPERSRTEGLTVATALVLAGGTAGWALAGPTAQSLGLTAAFAALAVLQAAAAVLFTYGLVTTRAEPAAPAAGTAPATPVRPPDRAHAVRAHTDVPPTDARPEQEGTA